MGQGNRPRVVAIGDSSVGKTSILTRLMGDPFNPYESNTVGANWHLHTTEVQGEPVELQIWDTAGEERYRSLGPLYYRNAVAAVAVYDVTSRGSFENVSSWIDAYRAVAGPDGLVFVVGNKTDLQDKRVVAFEEGLDWAQERRYEFCETSAQSNEGIEDLFKAVAEKVRTVPVPVFRTAQAEQPRPSKCC
jgi:small GTP-binding protein